MGAPLRRPGFVRIDPLIKTGPKRFTPFLWDDVAAPAKLDAPQTRLYGEAGELGISKGLSVPIHGHNGQYAMMSVVPDVNPRQADAHVRQHRDLLHLMSLYYHQHAGDMLIARHMGNNKQKALLTKRERECLQWVAVGKSACDISVILGISETVVLYHVENAKKKLYSSNRTHAVVKAVMLGLIEIG